MADATIVVAAGSLTTLFARSPGPPLELHQSHSNVAPRLATVAWSNQGGTTAVGIRLRLVGGTAGQVDRLNAAIDPDGNPPDGLIFHASGPVDGGWGVLDFWESREHFDRFAAERIGPAMAAIGAAGATDIREFPVDEHFPR